MRIVEKTKLYAADEKLMVKLDHDGWDHYDGRNWQWYSLLGVEVSGTPIYKLDASNSGDCYGDYSTQYFTAKGLKYWAGFHCKNITDLLGDISEDKYEIYKNLYDAII